MPESERPCLELIITADELAPPDGSHEAIEYGLELARKIGDIELADTCKLEYDAEFYCDDKNDISCGLRKAFKN